MKNRFQDFSSVTDPAQNRTSDLSDDGQLLYRMVEYARQNSQLRAKTIKGKTYHVSDVGKVVGGTFEKIRNSTENTEEHLLLQRAIRRFLYRNLFVEGRDSDDNLAEEMIIELTHAGYISQDSTTMVQVAEVTTIISKYVGLFNSIQSKLNLRSEDRARTWVLDVMSVQCVWVFSDPSYLFAFMYYANAHVMAKVTERGMDASGLHKNEQTFIYYTTILKQIVKADKTLARTVLLELYKVKHSPKDFIQFNKDFERLFIGDDAKSANLFLRKIGAPLHMVRIAFFEDDQHHASVILKRNSFLSAIEYTIEQEYEAAQVKLNNGIVRSIVFLVITKVLIGLAIELPIDFWLYGQVIWLPLAINLLTPPLLMLAQRITLKVPGRHNTEAILEYLQSSVYDQDTISIGRQARSKKLNSSSSRIFSAFYIVFSIALLAIVSWLLALSGFNIVQGIIFFIFVSTAMFLGYRLSVIIKDLELVQTNQTLGSVMRDFIYTPFIMMGQWIAGTYSRFNVIAMILDFAIELPLKTLLRRARQWTSFLEDRRDMLG